MRFKYYFNNLKTKDKMLSFLIIPLILFLLFILVEEYILKQDKTNIQYKIKLLKSSIKILKSKVDRPQSIVTIKYIEKIAVHFKIQILKIKINKLYFEIKTIGSYQNSMNFLRFMEQTMQTKTLNLYKEENDIVIDGKFKFYQLATEQTIEKLENIPNPFIQVSHRKATSNNILKLLAIFDQSVCINDTWYQKNDKVGKYTIQNIFKNYIELNEKNKIIRLEVYSNE